MSLDARSEWALLCYTPTSKLKVMLWLYHMIKIGCDHLLSLHNVLLYPTISIQEPYLSSSCSLGMPNIWSDSTLSDSLIAKGASLFLEVGEDVVILWSVCNNIIVLLPQRLHTIAVIDQTLIRLARSARRQPHICMRHVPPIQTDRFMRYYPTHRDRQMYKTSPTHTNIHIYDILPHPHRQTDVGDTRTHTYRCMRHLHPQKHI